MRLSFFGILSSRLQLFCSCNYKAILSFFQAISSHNINTSSKLHAEIEQIIAYLTKDAGNSGVLFFRFQPVGQAVYERPEKADEQQEDGGGDGQQAHHTASNPLYSPAKPPTPHGDSYR